MEIATTRFGRLDVEDERIITFPRGLLGFPSHTRFALIQTGEENYFFWLQCVDEPQLAFVVTDPSIFFKDYEVPIKDGTIRAIDLRQIKQDAGDFGPFEDFSELIQNPEVREIIELLSKLDGGR